MLFHIRSGGAIARNTSQYLGHRLTIMYAGQNVCFVGLLVYRSISILFVGGRSIEWGSPVYKSRAILFDSIHPALDSSRFLFCPYCWRALCAVRSPRGMGRRTCPLHPITVSTFILSARFLSNWRNCRLRHLGQRSLVSPTSLGMYVLSQMILATIVHVTDGSFTGDLQMHLCRFRQI